VSLIVVASAKGGVGKTTGALAVAAALALEPGPGEATVLIDLDPRGDATLRMGAPREAEMLGPLVVGKRRPFDHVGDFNVITAGHPTGEGFLLVPSSDDIETIEAHFSATAAGAELLQYRLRALGRECRLVVDTAPGIGTLLERAAIASADALIIPVIPEPLSERHVFEIVAIMRGMGGSARVYVIAAFAGAGGDDVGALNAALHREDLAVSAWYPHEAAVAAAVWSIGTVLRLAPQSQCATAYRDLAAHIHLGAQAK
jgi:cellulose biosynthesis protein BcsQ